jgi:hypothetical protein
MPVEEESSGPAAARETVCAGGVRADEPSAKNFEGSNARVFSWCCMLSQAARPKSASNPAAASETLGEVLT